jgi:hypothetical protein
MSAQRGIRRTSGLGGRTLSSVLIGNRFAPVSGMRGTVLMRHIFIAFAASVAMAFTAAGQQATPIPDRTPVRVRLLQFISSETSQPGQAVQFEVADDVAIGGLVAIARGTPAVGSVGWARAYRNSPPFWSWNSRSAAGQLGFTISKTTSVNGEAIQLLGPVVRSNQPPGRLLVSFDAVVLTPTQGAARSSY